MRTAVSVAFVLLVAACGRSLQSDGQAGDVTLTVERDPVAAADSVVLTLGNASAEAIGYNLCTSALERQGDGGWEAGPSDRVCTMELRTLEAGAEARYTTEVPAGLEAGEYRYSTTVEVLSTGERTGVSSDPFRLQP